MDVAVLCARCAPISKHTARIAVRKINRKWLRYQRVKGQPPRASHEPLNLPLVNSARGHGQHFGQHNTVTAIRTYTIASQCQVHMTAGSRNA